MLLNYANRDVLYRLSTIQDYVQGALRKKQLIVSFVKHFTENDGNTICIVFQFHNPKLRQEGCFKPCVYYTRLGRGRSTKEHNVSEVEHFQENHENIISIYFQNYIAKSSQETCFILSLIYGTSYIQGALRKMQLIGYFLDQFKKIEI